MKNKINILNLSLGLILALGLNAGALISTANAATAASSTKQGKEQVLKEYKADCEPLPTPEEQVVCIKKQFKAADLQLNKVYNAVIRTYKTTVYESEGYDMSYVGPLVTKAQKAWIPYVKALCDANSQGADISDTVSKYYNIKCMTEETIKKTKDLKDNHYIEASK